MERLIENYLLNWKNKLGRKPLILRGARQVGKTYSINHFGKNHFKYFLHLNLERYGNLSSLFKTNDPKLIIAELSAYFSVPIIEKNTLLFIDEIQVAPEVIVALRYFYEELPELHVIAAGSLLDHTLNNLQYSMPVGRVEFAYMYPMNFEEFLMAFEEKGLIEYIDNYSFNNKFSKVLHEKLLSLLRIYFFIGGMPEAISIFKNTNNLLQVSQVHESILSSLQYDFSKYGSKKEQNLMTECLRYVARNIGNRVKYSKINVQADSKTLKSVLLKLEMSRIVHLIHKTSSVNIPLNQKVDNNAYKAIFMDIGLANHLGAIKLNNLENLMTDYEGSLAEQFIGQELIVSKDYFTDNSLYYWQRDAKNANAEIDYLMQIDNNVYPVEVKAGKTGTLKSLQVFLFEKRKKTGIRFNADIPQIGVNLKAHVSLKSEKVQLNYDLISLPLYFAGFHKKIKEAVQSTKSEL